jgi:hypothetical protein
MDKLLHALRVQLLAKQDELAESAMLMPRAEPFEHGVQVGTYQGIQLALEALESLVEEEHAKEVRR